MRKAKGDLAEDSDEDIECVGITWEKVPQLMSDHHQWRNWSARYVSGTGGTKDLMSVD